MKPRKNRKKHLEDVSAASAASAAYLQNVLPELMALPPGERYERLRLHFRTSIRTFLAIERGRLFPSDPSPN